MRLQKFLAENGVASRRKSEELIENGLVSVNGEVVTKLGFKIDPDKDVVMYKDALVKPQENLVYIMLHKPEGYVTTAKDQFERATVLDIVRDVEARIYPVGRLDYDTSGLLIMTNDGDLTYRLTHPKHDVEKTYIARVLGVPTDESLDKFRNGLVIDDYKTSKAKIEIVKNEGRTSSLKIAIKEGKNRQVRKMCEAMGHKAIALKRIATGKLFLGELKRGEYRDLTMDEVKYLKKI